MAILADGGVTIWSYSPNYMPGSGERLIPADTAGGLDGDEECGDGEASEAAEEEGLGEEHEIEELAKGAIAENEAGAGDETEIAGEQGD